MFLYIIYIEPLLVYLEKRVTGIQGPLSLANTGLAPRNLCGGSTEAYCDDVNVITSSDRDLIVIDEGVRKFEAVSGAILSRNRKCQILGLGKWKRRVNWPLDYVVSVEEVKVFGVFLYNSYIRTLKKNWEFRYRKFEKTILSWSSRLLEYLDQRVQIVKMFALSRVFYVGSVLPMSKTVGKKFEKLIGKFIWSFSGKLLRVSLSDLKLPYGRGGLSLTCIHIMCKSLLLTQLLRLLRSDDTKPVNHVCYWIGEILGDLHPNFDQGNPPRTIPAYFQFLACTVADAKINELINDSNWKGVTNKIIYSTSINSLPCSKIELDAGISMDNVWKRLRYPSLSSSVRERMFLLIHHKLPIKERLHRIQLADNPYCDACDDFEICDIEHYFCLCKCVTECWTEMRTILNNLISVQVPNSDFLMLRFPKTSHETEITWLVGNYVNLIWNLLYEQGKRNVSKELMFGFLKYKYRCDQLGARSRFYIQMLSD